MILRFKKAELLVALEALRPLVKKIDAKALAAHTKEEDRALAEFHAACEAASKWDYMTAKKHYFRVVKRDGSDLSRGPTCPVSLESKLNRLISTAKVSEQKAYTIQPSGWTKGHYELLMLAQPQVTDLCE